MSRHFLAALVSTMAVMLAVPAAALDLGDPAPPLDIAQWVKGGPVDLADGKGKTAYVVEFWATWCPPCRKSIPHLTELQKKYKDEGVVFIGVSNEDADTVKPFVEKQGGNMDYVVAVDKNNATSQAYMGAFNVQGIPHAFVVDREGNLAWHGHPMDGLDQVLAKVTGGEAMDPKEQALEAEMRELLPLWAMQYLVLAKYGRDTAGADDVAGKVLAHAHRIPELANQLAWRALDGDKLAYQTPGFATKLAKVAYDATGGEEPAMIDTYARALFQNGKVADAIALQKKAIELAKDDPELVKKLQETLTFYEAQ
jgi:thiol-disulfide isomerase/thioredoxin